MKNDFGTRVLVRVTRGHPEMHLSASGRAFRVLAEEQLAYLLIEEGKPDAALTALAALMQDQAAPAGLRNRAAQMITALGGTVPGGAADQG